MEHKFVELVLTCENRAEAEKIADALLDQKLIACAKFVPVDSRFWWQGKIVYAQEILLLMESIADKFERIEAEVTRLHSYDTFVLQSIPMNQVSKQAALWLKEVIDG